MAKVFNQFWQNINRKKPLDNNLLNTNLNRCLGIIDLTLLGVIIFSIMSFS